MIYDFLISSVICIFVSAKLKHFDKSALLILGWKSLVSNEINLQFCLFLMFLNQVMTSLVFSHWLTLIAFRRFWFTLSSATLLILPRSFYAGFNRLVLGLFKKFGLWSFRVMKQLFLQLINFLFNAVLFSVTILSCVNFAVYFIRKLFASWCDGFGC